MKIFKNVSLLGYNGKPIQMMEKEGAPSVDLKLVTALYIILNNAPVKTQEDCKQGVRLALALDKAKETEGDIELEEGVHDWLKPIAEKLTPELFRLNANKIYEHIKEGFEKTNQPKEE